MSTDKGSHAAQSLLANSETTFAEVVVSPSVVDTVQSAIDMIEKYLHVDSSQLHTLVANVNRDLPSPHSAFASTGAHAQTNHCHFALFLLCCVADIRPSRNIR